MSHSIYERNLAALETVHPQLAVRLRQLQPSGRTQWLLTPNQVPSLQFQLPDGNPIPLHHPQNPIGETQAWIAKHQQTIQSQPLILLLGFGLGYHLLWLHQIVDPDTITIVIEPELEFLQYGLQAVDCSELWKNKNLIWCVGEPVESIKSILRSDRVNHRLTQSGITLLGLPAQLHIHREFLQRLTALIQDERRRTALRFRTNVSTTALTIQNISRNFSKVLHYGGIHPLHHRYAGIPAIVAAAGPSLEEALPILQAHQHNIVILAVDTAYPVLHHAGIEPLAVLAMDPTEENAQRLRGIERSPTFIVAYPGVHPDVVRAFEDRIVWYNLICDRERLPVTKFDEFFTWEKPLGTLLSFGSTAHVTISFARWLGCVPIVCTGMDLGYPAGRAYAQGVQSVPQREGAELQILSNAGDQIVTNEAYSYFIDGFPLFLQLTGTDLLTTSLHGAAIPGVPCRRWPEISLIPSNSIPPLYNRPLDRDLQSALESKLRVGLAQTEAVIPQLVQLANQWQHGTILSESDCATAIANMSQFKSLLIQFPAMELAVHLCPHGMTELLSGQSLRQLRNQDISVRETGYQSIVTFFNALLKAEEELRTIFKQIIARFD